MRRPRNSITTDHQRPCPMCRQPSWRIRLDPGAETLRVIRKPVGQPPADDRLFDPSRHTTPRLRIVDKTGSSKIRVPEGLTGVSSIRVSPDGETVVVWLCQSPECVRAVIDIEDAQGKPAGATIRVGSIEKSGRMSRGMNDMRCYHTSTLVR